MAKVEELSYEEWIELADEYYLATRSLQWFSAASYPTAFAGHHTLELYFKAIAFHHTHKFDKNSHDLLHLYKEAIIAHPVIKNKAVDIAVEKYANYEQVSRYTIKNSKTLPPQNGSIGTDSTNALDSAVFILRDVAVKTRNGLDRILEGQTERMTYGMTDPHFDLNCVILFHNNDSFKAINQEYLNRIQFSAPKYLL